jgi:hypothetical protein
VSRKGSTRGGGIAEMDGLFASGGGGLLVERGAGSVASASDGSMSGSIIAASDRGVTTIRLFEGLRTAAETLAEFVRLTGIVGSGVEVSTCG